MHFIRSGEDVNTVLAAVAVAVTALAALGLRRMAVQRASRWFAASMGLYVTQLVCSLVHSPGYMRATFALGGVVCAALGLRSSLRHYGRVARHLDGS